ncbi:hypothetical protein IVA86_33155 [Bradyrhizobium sp. 146]|uniref:hypothetical protein n=1 Tax=Bradyrhizobium sp. 146 TaxID=2782622 RepID=UPI001FF7012E|nr:hypothetical protein [Bradyrhizobium sp. 146]MCK1706122.1 hypothetical protein [Bradyrhizobium sp. 146]
MASFLNPRGRKNPTGEYPTVSVDDGWPEAHFVARPNDALGQAIIDFAKKWSAHPGFPASPWDPRVGDISLTPPDLPRAAGDPVPTYRLKEDAFLGPNLYSKGQDISHAGWPVRPHTLEPMNESASRVLSYMTRYGAGRTLPGMPYTAGVLNLPNPATTFGTPQNYVHRGTIGDLSPVP